jgi:hypothetical protein
MLSKPVMTMFYTDLGSISVTMGRLRNGQAEFWKSSLESPQELVELEY